jgi:hypothetical protein
VSTEPGQLQSHTVLPICWSGSNVLLGLARCGVCRRPATPHAEQLALMRWLDELCLATPFYGSGIGAVLRLTTPPGQPEAG